MRSHIHTEESSKSWTDDLPTCYYTGAGFATNELYNNPDPSIGQAQFKDRSFHCKIDDNTYLYAILSGHNGTKVADFSIQRMAAEIVLGQLNGKNTEEEVKDVLRQAFISVEKCYQDSTDSLLAKKAMLQYEIPENLSHNEIKQNYQHILKELDAINFELSIGCSVVLCLIHKSKLYICNVGTCRALLCKNDENKAPRVIQFSVDHNLYNEDEILRLCQMGLNITNLKRSNIYSTRCIGCYMAKAGYKDCEYLASATNEPVISQPEIVGGIQIDESFQFLLLMSSGLCKSLQEIYSGDITQENREIIRLTAKELQLQTSLMDVAQSVVDKVVKIHHNTYVKQSDSGLNISYREDIALLLRNFNVLPNDIQKKNNQVKFNPVVQELSNTLQNTETEIYTVSNTSNSFYTDTTTSTSSDINGRFETIVDKTRKIQPYVDFRSYYKKVEEAKRCGKLPEGIDFD